MAFAPKQIKISPTEYLDGEINTDIKHQYDNSYIVAMVGASRSHNLT